MLEYLTIFKFYDNKEINIENVEDCLIIKNWLIWYWILVLMKYSEYFRNCLVDIEETLSL